MHFQVTSLETNSGLYFIKVTKIADCFFTNPPFDKPSLSLFFLVEIKGNYDKGTSEKKEKDTKKGTVVKHNILESCILRLL